jgi:hypothetical protein
MNIKLKKAIIINRPSKTIKSPYLADIIINETTELAHSPRCKKYGIFSVVTSDWIYVYIFNRL